MSQRYLYILSHSQDRSSPSVCGATCAAVNDLLGERRLQAVYERQQLILCHRKLTPHAQDPQPQHEADSSSSMRVANILTQSCAEAPSYLLPRVAIIE